jgi:hypothetical protein
MEGFSGGHRCTSIRKGVPPKGRAANDNNPTQDEKLKIEIDARIAPVPLTIGRKDSSTVYLGSYLVNAVGGCNDCHTNHLLPQAEIRTSASLRRSTRPNIWAAERHLVRLLRATSRRMPQVSHAGLSYSDFVQVIRTGKDFDNVHGVGIPLHVMPWPVYQSLTDRDLTAIYTYLSAIPCLEGDPGVNPSAPALSLRPLD